MALDFDKIAQILDERFYGSYQAAFNYFFDPKVRCCPEYANQSAPYSWTRYFNEKYPLLPKPPKNMSRFVELDRMLSSLLWCLGFSNDAIDSQDVFETTVEKQANDKLTQENFAEITSLFAEIKAKPNQYRALQAALIFSDLGKTEQAEAKAAELGMHLPPDHDDFMEALLSQENAIIKQVLPSVDAIDPAAFLIIKNISLALKVHFGHVKHLEGGATQLLAGFQDACRKGLMTKDVLKLGFAVHLCDVASSAAHVDPLRNAITESSYQFDKLVYAMLNSILDGTDYNAAFKEFYQNNIVKAHFGVETEMPLDHVAIRIATMLRWRSENGFAAIKTALGNLGEMDKQLVIDTMQPGGLFDSLPRNPSYFNSFLLNIASSTENDKAELVAKALVSEVKVLRKFADKAHQAPSYRLCFVKLANAAKDNPSFFTTDTFNLDDIELDNDFNVKKNDGVSQLQKLVTHM